MKQVIRSGVLILLMMALFCPHAACGEKEVLQALDAVKDCVEAGVSPDTLKELLDEAKAQIDTLNEKDFRNDCFREAVMNCYYWYNLARKTRETMIKNQEERDRYDQKAIFGEVHMRRTYEKMVANYEQLIRHAYEGLPSKWENGNTALQMARECREAAD